MKEGGQAYPVVMKGSIALLAPPLPLFLRPCFEVPYWNHEQTTQNHGQSWEVTGLSALASVYLHMHKISHTKGVKLTVGICLVSVGLELASIIRLVSDESGSYDDIGIVDVPWDY